MSIGTYLRAGGRTLFDRPADILPVYLLAIGLLLTAQVPILLAVGAIAVVLVRSGALEALVDEFEAIDQEAFDPDSFDPADQAAAEPIPPGLEEALLGMGTPTVVSLFLLGLLASVLVVLFARAFANAATLSGVDAALRGEDAVRGAVDGVADHWKPFVALSLIEATLLSVAALPVVGSLALIAINPPIGVLALFVSMLFGLAAGLVVLVGFAFAGQAIVVDRVGAFSAIRRSLKLIVARPVAVGSYVLVAIGLFGASTTLSAVFGLLGVSQLSGLMGPLVVVPFVDTFKTALYADRAHTPIDRPPIGDRLLAAFGDGVRSMAAFVRDHPLAHVGAILVFSGGVAFGGWLTSGVDIPFEGPEDVGAIFGTFPVGTFVSIAVNNWLVGASAAFGGAVLGIPTAVNLLFNGALIGGVYGVSDPLVFYALVAPHGVIELPAIFVACAAGFYLAAVVGSAILRRRDRAAVVSAVGVTYRVTIGLAIVFVIAAFVEAFLTPPIAEFVLA
ncbi:MAG: stage II sporulation protein M [Halobacteriota archaeon]